jgi:histidinol-phosphate aminotransferase
VVRLDTNTSPFLPHAALEDLGQVLDGLRVNDYPDTSYLALREGLASYAGKDIERFVVTNGADEGVDIATKVFLDPGDEAIIPTPTYSMYRIGTAIMGAKVKQVPRRADFSLDVERILGSIDARTRLIFICNPNNPTGNFSPLEEIERLAKDGGVPVFVDEAYYEMYGKSAVDLTDSYDNIIVCRTFSKAFSMAGVRVGYLVAKKETVERLNMVRPPNSLSVISLLLAQAALKHAAEMRQNVQTTVEERGRLLERLAEVPGVRPYPSATNFILFKVEDGKDADVVHNRLMRKGLVLRNLSHVRGVENCLRTTVATADINDRLLAALKSAL